jgi:flagellar biosynthesis/type III secretory pathway protein FliH
MSSEKVARLLTDFDRQEPKVRSRVVPFDHTQHSSAKVQLRPAAPPEDDAYQRGRSEGYAAALAEYEQKLDDESHKLRAQLAEERDNLLNETAGKIAGDIAEIGNQLETKIAGVAARILEPFISSALQKQAVATFVEQLSSLTSDSRRPTLRITGPSDLLELVRSKLGVRSIAVELRIAPAAEVSVVVDQLVLETQVKLWAERLKLAILT